MAKRSIDERNSERVKVEDKKLPKPKTVRLVLMKNVKLTVEGPVTGRRYVFSGAGAEVDVDERDAKMMKDKISGAGCCDGSGIGQPTPYFEER